MYIGSLLQIVLLRLSLHLEIGKLVSLLFDLGSHRPNSRAAFVYHLRNDHHRFRSVAMDNQQSLVRTSLL